MDWDDVRPKPKASLVIGEDLRTHSVADLRERIASCEAEVLRVRAEIEKREVHEKAAASIFKS
jgi:uncharacterized small protein (DUF1192 family)